MAYKFIESLLNLKIKENLEAYLHCCGCQYKAKRFEISNFWKRSADAKPKNDKKHHIYHW